MIKFTYLMLIYQKKKKFFESDTYTPGDKAVLGELNFGGKKN